jgi:hypothetical protein
MNWNYDLWTASASGSDNATGIVSIIAPMKVNFLKLVAIENRRRSGVMLLTSLFVISLALMTGVAQLKNPKRVTAIQLGQAAEGARVTIVSDAALNDYEAFRRGDRFYVKIPLADLAAAQPNFHGDGFADILVQRVGDSVVISFGLQPGASARVDQRSNRLDVIFSAPNRLARINNPNSNRGTVSIVPVNGTSNLQSRYSAGPTPPSSPPVSRERVVSETGVDGRGGQSSRVHDNPRVDSNKKGSGLQTSNTTVPPAPKSDSSTPVLPSTSPNYPALSTGTPVSVPSKPVANFPGSLESPNWKTRGKAALQWVAANRMASLLAAVLLLSLLVFFGSSVYRRRKNAVKAKRAKAPGVQPKYSPNVELNEKLAGPASARASASSELVSDYESSPSRSASPSLAASVLAANDVRGSAVPEKASRPRIVPEPAVSESAAIATPQSGSWVLTKPSIASSTAGENEAISEDQEREVFEL